MSLVHRDNTFLALAASDPPACRAFSAAAAAVNLIVNPLVLPARLSGAAAGNFAHRYIGKVCCLLLVRPDYIRPRPRARPRRHGELLKLLRLVHCE